MVISNNHTLYNIDGIFGRVLHSDLELNGRCYKARHSAEERKNETNETVSYRDETSGLPIDITMDDYFKMALLQKLDDIGNKLSKNQNITLNVELDDVSNETLQKITSLLYGKDVVVKQK